MKNWPITITVLILGLVLVALLVLQGCQWSAYNSYDYADGVKVAEVHVGTIEFLVRDDKSGLAVELADGTMLGLAATATEPDSEAIKTGVMDALRLWTAGGL